MKTNSRAKYLLSDSLETVINIANLRIQNPENDLILDGVNKLNRDYSNKEIENLRLKIIEVTTRSLAEEFELFLASAGVRIRDSETFGKFVDFTYPYNLKKLLSNSILLVAFIIFIDEIDDVYRFLNDVLDVNDNEGLLVIDWFDGRNHVSSKLGLLLNLEIEKLSEKEILTSLSGDVCDFKIMAKVENGQLRVLLPEIIDSINGVNITRIRECDVCKEFFWAKRKDSYACSLKHAKVRQMRKLRKNWNKSGGLYLNARKTKKEKEIKDDGDI